MQGPKATALAEVEEKMQKGRCPAQPEPQSRRVTRQAPWRDAAGAGLPGELAATQRFWLCRARIYTARDITTRVYTAYPQRPSSLAPQRTGAGPGGVRLQVTWRPGRRCPAFFPTASGDSEPISTAWVKEQGRPVFGFCFSFSLTSGFNSQALCNILPLTALAFRRRHMDF